MTQQNSASDSDANMILIVAIFILLFIFFWYFKVEIIQALMFIAKWKAYAASLIGFDPNMAKAFEGISNLEQHDFEEMTYGEAIGIGNFAGKYVAYLIAGIVVFMAYRMTKATPMTKYRRNFDLYTLLEKKALHFPSVRPIIGLDILSKPMDTGDWAVMKSAINFCLMHNLMYGMVKDPRTGKVVRRKLKVKLASDLDPENSGEIRFDRAAAKQVLEEQLGLLLVENGIIQTKKWRSWPKHYKALIAVFLLRCYGGKSERVLSDQLLIQYNNSFYYPNYKKTGKPDIKLKDLNIDGVDDVLSTFFDKPAEMPKSLKKLFRKHAYLTTFTAALLSINTGARKKGLLISPDFIWLRPIDRTLWYLLNSEGRRVPPPECCGPWAHNLAEDTIDAYCTDPEVEKGVDAIQAALISEGWMHEENSENYVKSSSVRSKNRQRR